VITIHRRQRMPWSIDQFGSGVWITAGVVIDFA
jgi:hypothetical protein